MAFSDLQLKVAAESAIQAAHANLAKLGLFAKSYSELAGTYGQSIAIPVYDLNAAGAFVADSNNYGSGVNEVDGAVLTLDQHLVKSVAISDRQLAETGINWMRDTTIAITDTLTRGVNAYVFGLINATNVTKTVSSTLATKTLVAELYKTAADNDIPVDKCIVVLNPENYAKVLSVLDSNVFGGPDAIRYGVIPNLYGFAGFVCTTNLPEGTKGAIVMKDAIGVGARYLAPSVPDAYPESFIANDGDIMPLGFRRFMDLNKGIEFLAGDVLFGAKVLQADKIVRIVD